MPVDYLEEYVKKKKKRKPLTPDNYYTTNTYART